MGYIEGLLGGFLDRKYGVEAENRRQSDLAAERERSVFNALLNADDPETRNLALAGLLDSANPRRKAGGLRGWVGETIGSPYLERIRTLSPTVTEEVEETRFSLPSTQMAGGQALPNVQPAITEAPESAGMPPTSPVQPGAPPPTPVSYTVAPPTPETFKRLATRPREAFLSPQAKYEQQAIAKERAEVAGMRAGLAEAGFTPDEQKEVIRGSLMRKAGGMTGMTYGEGNVIPDPDSPTGWSQELFLRADPTKRQRIPAQPPLTPETMAARTRATVQARADVQASAPLSAEERTKWQFRLQDDWRKIQAPIREMQRQHQLMTTGLSRYKQGDRIGGSQAVLVTFQKILDPTSVVREAEYERSPAGLALKQRIQGMYERYIGQWDPATQKWVGGGAGVPEAELAEMVETARQFLAGMESWNANERGIIEGTAKDLQIDPTRIFGAGATAGASPSPTAPGTQAAPAAPAVPGMIKGPDGKWMIRRPGG